MGANKGSEFDTGSATHQGMARTANEDSYLVLPDIGIWVVGDGMGGHEYGGLASATLVEVIGSVGQPVSAPDLLARFEDRVIKANRELVELSRQEEGAIIGSTLAAVLVYGMDYACVWSGDSRVYLIRDNRISQITRDHSEVQELLDQNILNAEEAETWPRRNVITRAIGAANEPDLELINGMLNSGDTFLICSDGLTSHLNDDEIFEIANSTPPQIACDELVAKTLERGASDNVTVVILRYCPQDRSVKADSARPERQFRDIWE